MHVLVAEFTAVPYFPEGLQRHNARCNKRIRTHSGRDDNPFMGVAQKHTQYMAAVCKWPQHYVYTGLEYYKRHILMQLLIIRTFTDSYGTVTVPRRLERGRGTRAVEARGTTGASASLCARVLAGRAGGRGCVRTHVIHDYDSPLAGGGCRAANRVTKRDKNRNTLHCRCKVLNGKAVTRLQYGGIMATVITPLTS